MKLVKYELVIRGGHRDRTDYICQLFHMARHILN